MMFRVALIVIALLAASRGYADPPTAEQEAAALNEAAADRAAGRFAAAAQKYCGYARKAPDRPGAAEAHRLAILCCADLLRDADADRRPAIAKVYESLLEEHLRTWPTQPTADDVRMWQARLLIVRREWPTAVALLQQIRPTSDNYAESITLMADCYDRQLASLPAAASAQSPQREALLADATRSLQPVITGPQNRWPEAWSKAQRSAATALAGLHLRYAEAASPYAATMLAAAIRGKPESADAGDEAWQMAARTQLVAALALNGRLEDAAQIAGDVKQAPPETLLDAIAIVVREIPPGVATDRSKSLGQLALRLSELVDARGSDLDTSQLARLEKYRAAALAAVGDREAALSQYAKSVEQLPNDGDVQEQFAALLGDSDSPADLRQSLERWQRIEKRSRPGGDRWRRARRARIALLRSLNNQSEANQLESIARAILPDWDAPNSNEK